MENEAVSPPKPKGNGKAKMELAQRRNRRVLGDIGNVEVVRAAEGKRQVQISRPITRDFHAQLLAKEQTAANHKNPAIAAAENKVTVDRKVT